MRALHTTGPSPHGTASWAPLPEGSWQATIRSLHRWSQIVGKVRLGLAAPMNHWWHVTLYVSARGLTTSAIPYEGELIEFEFDLGAHVLRLRTSGGESGVIPLRSMPVSTFYAEFLELLRVAGIDVRITPTPVEVADAIPFPADTGPGSYEHAHAVALHGALVDAQRVLSRFRAGFLGKASPVHFFWGGFDLATTRFSGRPAPRHPGGVPNCPDYVMAEAYSHEVSSAGWWPGTPETGPAFYAYMYPEPTGYRTTSIAPARGAYDPALGEFILPERDLADVDDPDAAVLAFLEATYGAGATQDGWDRATLEVKRETGG